MAKAKFPKAVYLTRNSEGFWEAHERPEDGAEGDVTPMGRYVLVEVGQVVRAESEFVLPLPQKPK